MTPCSAVQEMLLDHLDGELPGASSSRVERHLAACPRCRLEVEELRRTLGSVRSLPGSEPPSPSWGAFRDEVRARIALLPPPRPSLRDRLAGLLPLRPLPALGLATALGLFLAIGLIRSPRPLPQPSVAEVAVASEASESLGIGMNLDLLRDLDLLEALDDLEVVPPPRGEGRPGRLG